MISRSTPRFCGTMKGPTAWLTAFLLHSVMATSLAHHHRRSMAAPSIYPVSKGGWRPVVGSGSLPAFAPFPAAPLHAPPSYKIPVPVLEPYPSSSRPIAARDAAKITAGAQQYRPTTLRTQLQSQSPSPNQPINTYLNPFGLQNGLSHYKIVQNFPMESVVIRNPHNPYMARPAFTKYPLKYKQHPNIQQQLNNVQQIQFGLPFPNKHQDVFSKPVEVYVRPTESKKPQTYKDPNAPEIFKPEVYKIDSDTAPQSVAQQVKTAQQQQNQKTVQYQQNLAAPKPKPAQSHYQQYAYKDEKFAPLPPSILGTYNPFTIQAVKGRDPAFPVKQTTYVPPLPAKQTVFNSFSYTPTFKTSANPFLSTTPRLQTTLQQNYNHLLYGQVNDYKIPPTQQVKFSTPYKSELGTPNKGNFKASPQDPFSKQNGHKHQNSHNNKLPQVTTYTPSPPATTPPSYFSDFSGRLPAQPPSQNTPFTSYYNQNYDKKKYVHPDSFASSVNHPPGSQYPSPPKKQEFEATPNIVPFRATYDVTELYGEDIITHSSPHSWSPTSDNNVAQYTQQRPEEIVTKSVFTEVSHPNLYTKPTTVATSLPEEYEIVTESYDNNLQHDTHLETQTRRPLGDEFEPIGKHKLKDYYYRVSTPAQIDYTTNYKRTKNRPSETTVKPTEPYEDNFEQNKVIENGQTDNLPTLPPSLHFKRPTGQESLDKDKIRKRNKIRRRRPPQASRVTEREETSTRKYVSPSTDFYTTEADEVHTYRPRPRYNQKSKSTTPTITTDLSTSALPTVTPTTPTTNIIKKKIRRPVTTPSERFETTTITYKESEPNKESTIMKIASRDYSHKQDEKDTPTSDISVSLFETTSRSRLDPMKFSFHKDVKPLDSKPELLVKGVEKPNNEIKATTSNYLPETTKQDNNEDLAEIDTTTPKLETPEKGIRPRIKHKYDSNRPRFSVKDYRNRLSSTTTTERSNEAHMPKLRFPQRRLPYQENRNNSDDNSTDIARKKFIPKDPRYKGNGEEIIDTTTEKEVQARHVYRQRSTTETPETTQKISSRVRGGQRRPTKPVEESTEPITPTTHKRVVVRKKVKDTELSATVQDVSVTEMSDKKEDAAGEKKKSESAIMKIAKEDKKYTDLDTLYEHSKRVSDLTLAASKDYNTPGMFKAVSPNSRRIPNYFTIATDDPILPIEAFFPQLNQKKES